MTQKNVEAGITRRQFLFTLGTLAGAAISGWTLFAMRGQNEAPVNGEENAIGGPSLHPGLYISQTEFGAEIYDRSSPERETPVCVVNRLGLRVIDHMDGESTPDEIAGDLLLHLGAPQSDIESFKSSVAMFITELASAGLLSAPFFVNIHASEVSA